ncbi:DOPA 4,5-dioxygenase family protein [Kiloniella laminariae]|uniref:DOPA 4,5-dioxygenase family protein n=1 Tax=Kiloniella laminariae TaxID=454162 RepID=A0ABT4LRG1_9PROT|nr:DOPA 4,5-dioxygenase family protein [Kiloniella laminariae]MCZ4282916.1 DOPA 4,5-dioxygenase family protein [Kiloniella laminariae]
MIDHRPVQAQKISEFDKAVGLELADFHLHVYYDATTIEQAKQLCLAAATRFGLRMGFMHEKPVGPHPRWSCQLSVPPEKFGAVVTWFSLNRKGLTLFIHPDSGRALQDHRDHAIWMGEMLELDLSIFS